MFLYKNLFFFNTFYSFNPNRAYWNQRRLFSYNLPGMFVHSFRQKFEGVVSVTSFSSPVGASFFKLYTLLSNDSYISKRCLLSLTEEGGVGPTLVYVTPVEGYLRAVNGNSTWVVQFILNKKSQQLVISAFNGISFPGSFPLAFPLSLQVYKAIANIISQSEPYFFWKKIGLTLIILSYLGHCRVVSSRVSFIWLSVFI